MIKGRSDGYKVGGLRPARLRFDRLGGDPMTTPAAPERTFRYAFADRYRLPARLFGIAATNSWVSVADGTFSAKFGPWHLTSAITNIRQVSLTGPYSFIKTAGPARLSLADRGITFATNGVQGVFVEFREPVPGIDPLRVIKHPNLTVTVAECDELISVLRTVGSTENG